jgi:hypothetical protein
MEREWVCRAPSVKKVSNGGSVTQLDRDQRTEDRDQRSAVSAKEKPQMIPQSREYRTV